jgi:hypothetical protein
MRDRILNWLALYSISGGGVQQAGTQEAQACKLQLQAAANNIKSASPSPCKPFMEEK